MSGIRAINTRPELSIRRLLFARGLRFRLHVKDLPGKPDLVFPKYEAVLFVHGCFWHRHESCRFTSTPASNVDFWMKKFKANLSRDARAIRALREQGWRVAVVWECELREEARATKMADRIAAWLRSTKRLWRPTLPPEPSTVRALPRLPAERGMAVPRSRPA